MKKMSFQTDTRLTRQNQIKALRVFNENVAEVVEGSEYRINFKCQELSLCLSIRLPASFPTEKPVIDCHPTVVNHPWVNPATGRVDAPGLRNFSLHSDLGMVVLTIRRELEKSQLKLLVPQSAAGGAAVQKAQQQQQQQLAASSSTSIAPDFIKSRLNQLSSEDLTEILQEEDAFLKEISNLSDPQLAEIEGTVTSQREGLRVRAEENIQLQNKIEAKRAEFIEKLEKYHQLKSGLCDSYERLKELEARVEPNILADKLLRLSVSCEEESDEIAEKFLNRGIPVDDFIKNYIRTRQESHVRKLKADKVKQMKVVGN